MSDHKKKVRIEAGLSPHMTKIFMGDEEIQNMVVSATLIMKVGQANKLILEVLPYDLSVEMEALVEVSQIGIEQMAISNEIDFLEEDLEDYITSNRKSPREG
jgi:hypothetical protein